MNSALLRPRATFGLCKVLSVPQKAVIDLQNTWLEKNSWIEMVSAAPDLCAASARLARHPMNAQRPPPNPRFPGQSEKERDKYQHPLRKRPTVLYDEVRCCVYCAQFFTKNQQDFYRVHPSFPVASRAHLALNTAPRLPPSDQPSYESKVAEQRGKAERAAAEQARAYWDPLATVEQQKKTELEELERTVKLMSTLGIGSPTSHEAAEGANDA